MRIARIDVFGLQVAYRFGSFSLSGERTAASEPSTLVRVTTDDGIEGWGESCPLTGAYLPAFGGGVRAALAELAPALIGADPRNLAEVTALMDATLLGQEAAKSALDVACWDVLGQAVSLPVATLLGGRVSERLPLYEAIPLGTPDETAQRLQESWDRGFRRFQLKVGTDPRADVVAVRRVLELTGEEGLVIVDANGGWRLDDALVAVRLLEPLPVYLEQPCRTFAECLHVRRTTGLPMIYDEVVTDSASLMRAVQEGGASVVNLKVSKVGGLTRAKQLRDLAHSLGARVMIEDSWGGDVATAAIAHLAASTQPSSLFAVSFVNDATDGLIAGHNPRSEAGHSAAPTAPGLGIAVDPAPLGQPLFSFS
jgi:L-alanine-DL-glutamate epimerase-like enolase superfamily enzyme